MDLVVEQGDPCAQFRRGVEDVVYSRFTVIARKALPYFVSLLVVAAACGSGSTRRSTSKRAPHAGPADVSAMRVLLERYSPTGHYIVSTYEGLPSRFVIGDTTHTVSHSKGFGESRIGGISDRWIIGMGSQSHFSSNRYGSLSIGDESFGSGAFFPTFFKPCRGLNRSLWTWASIQLISRR